MKKNKTNTAEIIRDAEVVDTAASKTQVARRLKEQEIAKKIEAVLVESGMALQPFLGYSEYGVVPRVRLVENKPETNGQGNSKEQTEGTGDTDTTIESVEA